MTIKQLFSAQMNFWRWFLLMAIGFRMLGIGVDVHPVAFFVLVMAALAGAPYQSHEMRCYHVAEKPMRVALEPRERDNRRLDGAV